MKPKPQQTPPWRYYIIIAILLTGLAFYPTLNFAMMARGFTQYSLSAIIPFMAVSAAILLGFSLLPLLQRLPPHIRHIIISAIGILAFIGLDILSQHVAINAYMLIPRRAPSWDMRPLDELIHSRMMHPSRWPSAPPVYGRAMGFIGNAWTIPWSIRAHYYVFSIILVVAALNWLANLSEALSGRAVFSEAYQKKFLVIQGAAIACYALAYLLVRAVQYDNLATGHITWGSVLNSAVCFILAGVAAGLYGGSLLRARYRFAIAPLIAVSIVLVLYMAQFFMLGMGLYNFGSSAFIAYAVRALIVLTPGAIVYLLLRLAFKPQSPPLQGESP